MENRLLNFEQSLANFSFCIAADFHDLSKKCIALERKKHSHLEEWRKKVELQHQDQQTSTNAIDTSRTDALRQRIQKHKEDMQSRAANPGQPGSIIYPPEVSKFVFDKFVAEIQPQVIAKYPNVPMFKVNKVVVQKWNSLDPNKKSMFIAKWSSKEAEFMQKKNEESNAEEVFVKQEAVEPEFYTQKIEEHAHNEVNEREEGQHEQHNKQESEFQANTEQEERSERIEEEQTSQAGEESQERASSKMDIEA